MQLVICSFQYRGGICSAALKNIREGRADMASLIRSLSRLGPRVLMSTCTRLPSASGILSLPSISRAIQPACFISTSEKNKDVATLGDKTHHVPAKPEKLENLEEKEEVEVLKYICVSLSCIGI